MGFEDWCLIFNQYILIIFKYLKFGFILALSFLGILTLIKLRGIYFEKERVIEKSDHNNFKNIRLVVGLLFIFLAIGIYFNFLTYLLLFILDPLPDGFILNFLAFIGAIDPILINRLEHVSSETYPHEATIYYCLALCSFWGFLHLLISITLILHSGLNRKPRSVIINFISSLIECVLFGFTTFMPLFLQ